MSCRGGLGLHQNTKRSSEPVSNFLISLLPNWWQGSAGASPARKELTSTLDLSGPFRQTKVVTGNLGAFESRTHTPLPLPTGRTTSSTISMDGRSACAAGSSVLAQLHCKFSVNEQTHKPATPAKEDDTSGKIQWKCETQIRLGRHHGSRPAAQPTNFEIDSTRSPQP